MQHTVFGLCARTFFAAGFLTPLGLEGVACDVMCLHINDQIAAITYLGRLGLGGRLGL